MSEAVTGVTSVLWSVNNKSLSKHLSMTLLGWTVSTMFSSSGWETRKVAGPFCPRLPQHCIFLWCREPSNLLDQEGAVLERRELRGKYESCNFTENFVSPYTKIQKSNRSTPNFILTIIIVFCPTNIKQPIPTCAKPDQSQEVSLAW